jgi:putative ABC transport system permease protein
MIRIALKMLVNDRAKYAGLLFGVTFTSFLVTFAASYFAGMMTRGFALIAENPGVDVWVMDPAVRAVDLTIDLPSSALDRVRSVQGVASASPMVLATADVRFPDGRFQPLQVIGVDDATLDGVPPLREGASAQILHASGAVIVDDGGTNGKLESPRRETDRWPHDGPHLDAPTRHLECGDELLVNDTLVRVAGISEGLPRYPPRPLLFTTRSTALQFLPPESHRLTFVLARGADGVDPARLASLIEATTGLRARTASDFASDTVYWTLAHSEDTGDAVTMLSIAVLVGFGVTGVMMFLFTNENMKYYAVFTAMGASMMQSLSMVLAQTGLCALLGTGLGLGLCAIAGKAFLRAGFPYRMLWFAPVAGAGAVLLVSLAAAAVAAWPLSRMQPASFLEGR